MAVFGRYFWARPVRLPRRLRCVAPPAPRVRAAACLGGVAAAAALGVPRPPAAAQGPSAFASAAALPAPPLLGQACLVTGGASGIGRAVCVRLAAEGAAVAVLDVRREPREGGGDVLALMAAVRRERGLPQREDLFVCGSVSSAADVAEAVGTAALSFGRLDVLVTSAARMDGKPLLETSEEDWDGVMGVNAKGVFLCMKAAVAQFLLQERRGPDGIRGRIVNISSQHGMVHCPGNVAYGTSKAAVAYMTKQVGCEYIGEGIVVNAVAPGRILTGRVGSRMEADTPEEQADLQQSFARTPYGAIRLGKPDDVARAVAFLASDQAGFIVGENLMVDGGYKAS